MVKDSLFDRADLAIQNSARHRQERRVLMTQHGDARDDLRRSVFESKMIRVEVATRREDQQFLKRAGIERLPRTMSKSIRRRKE